MVVSSFHLMNQHRKARFYEHSQISLNNDHHFGRRDPARPCRIAYSRDTGIKRLSEFQHRIAASRLALYLHD
jgi:hypothetical protein